MDAWATESIGTTPTTEHSFPTSRIVPAAEIAGTSILGSLAAGRSTSAIRGCNRESRFCPCLAVPVGAGREASGCRDREAVARCTKNTVGAEGDRKEPQHLSKVQRVGDRARAEGARNLGRELLRAGRRGAPEIFPADAR